MSSTGSSRTARLLGLIVAGIGLAHFIDPRSFMVMTRVAFPRNTQTYVYVNGGLETAIGLLLSRAHTRGAGVVALIAYGVYLAGNATRTLARRARFTSRRQA